MPTETAANVTTNLTSTHAATNLQTGWPDHVSPSATTGRVMPRAEAFARTPTLEALASDVYSQLGEAKRGNDKPICGAIVHASDALQGLLQDSDVGPQTLVMMLPPEFEPVLHFLVAQEPEIFNYPTVDLQQNRTYLGYSVILPRQSAVTEIWLSEWMLCTPLCACLQEDVSETDTGPQAGKRLPVIMMAGGSVAVGGFEVDEYFVGDAQAASMSARSSMPEELYPDEQLRTGAELAATVGPAPWTRGYWCVRDHLTSWRDGRASVATECAFFV